VQATITLITHIVATYTIDTKRIYVAGLSAGGSMAAILGEQYPEIFSAVGVHSGLPTGIAHSLPDALQSMRGIGLHARKKPLLVPTIAFHGDADATVSLANARHFADAMALQSASTAESMTGGEGRAFTREIDRRSDNAVVGEYW
jgi:poly(3-hydroxybutyrate) depolymerase